MIEAVHRAMIALDAYWARHGTPDPCVIAQVLAKLEAHSSHRSDDWRALLDHTLQHLGYSTEWRGEEVYDLTQTSA